MARPVLPDPPAKFSSYDSWMKLSSSSPSRWRSLWRRRSAELGNLDHAIAHHEQQHARLAAAYDQERQRYLAAYAKAEVAIMGSAAELDALSAIYWHLHAALRIFNELIGSRRKLETQFASWMGLHDFGDEEARVGESARGHNAYPKLLQFRVQLRQEQQDALNDRLVLSNMLADIEQRLRDVTSVGPSDSLGKPWPQRGSAAADVYNRT